MNIDDHTNCPSCNAQWKGEDIYENLRSLPSHANKSDAEVKESAEMYGWTEENKKTYSNLIRVQVRGEYDGTLLWQCPDCKTYYGRFSGNEYPTWDDIDFHAERSARYQ